MLFQSARCDLGNSAQLGDSAAHRPGKAFGALNRRATCDESCPQFRVGNSRQGRQEPAEIVDRDPGGDVLTVFTAISPYDASVFNTFHEAGRLTFVCGHVPFVPLEEAAPTS